MLLLQPLKPEGLLWSFDLLLRRLGKPQVVGSVCMPDDLFLPGCLETHLSIFADRLQHEQAWLLPFLLGLLQHTLVDERSHSLEHLSRGITKYRTDRLHRLQGAATCEHGEPLLGSI